MGYIVKINMQNWLSGEWQQVALVWIDWLSYADLVVSLRGIHCWKPGTQYSPAPAVWSWWKWWLAWGADMWSLMSFGRGRWNPELHFTATSLRKGGVPRGHSAAWLQDAACLRVDRGSRSSLISYKETVSTEPLKSLLTWQVPILISFLNLSFERRVRFELIALCIAWVQRCSKSDDLVKQLQLNQPSTKISGHQSPWWAALHPRYHEFPNHDGVTSGAPQWIHNCDCWLRTWWILLSCLLLL